jgi:hypothetical protein
MKHARVQYKFPGSRLPVDLIGDLIIELGFPFLIYFLEKLCGDVFWQGNGENKAALFL